MRSAKAAKKLLTQWGIGEDAPQSKPEHEIGDGTRGQMQ